MTEQKAEITLTKKKKKPGYGGKSQVGMGARLVTAAEKKADPKWQHR